VAEAGSRRGLGDAGLGQQSASSMNSRYTVLAPGRVRSVMPAVRQPIALPSGTHVAADSTLSMLWTLSSDRSNEAMMPTPVLSAQATR
jgi:hypothetical protein